MAAIQMLALGKKLANSYAARCLPVCRKYGINQTCFDILLFCANNPDHNTARDVCSLRGIKSGIASVSVEMLIENGLLTRTPDPADRRKHRLVPTEQAAAVIEAGREMQRQFASALRRGIAEEELATMERVFGKVEENLIQLGKQEREKC